MRDDQPPLGFWLLVLCAAAGLAGAMVPLNEPVLCAFAVAAAVAASREVRDLVRIERENAVRRAVRAQHLRRSGL